MNNWIVAAENDIERYALVITKPMTLAASSYSYSVGEVNLFLAPTENLTWYMWAMLPTLIQQFVTENGFKRTQSILWEPRLGPSTLTSLLSLPGYNIF